MPYSRKDDVDMTFAYEEAHPEDGPFCWENHHEPIPQKPLDELLAHEQYLMFKTWMDAEGLDWGEIDYDDSLLNGIRIWANDPKTDERWEIDFTREEDK